MAVSKENTRILITVPKELKAKLEHLAKEENRTLSNYVVTELQKNLPK